MLDAITPENLAARLVIAAGQMPKLYALNLDKPDGFGRCPENGTVLCPECYGMWAPELLPRAVTHVDRGACNRQKAERESREVPFRPENMRMLLNITIPELAPSRPETFRGFTLWDTW